MAGLGLLAARKRVDLRRPLLPSWTTTREFGGYASRMQLASLTGFVNAELDGFVIAWVAGVKYVGIYSIGLQAASAARSVPMYAFSPLLTRLTTTFRSAGRGATAEEFDRLERRWVPSVVAFGVVAVAAIGFSVPIWLGHTYVLSGVTAVILLSCYIVHVGFTGMRTCFVRAVGRPGLEARYSTVWTVLNALLTVPLALLAGMLGVVGATAVTGVVASGYFVWLCRRSEGLPLLLPDRVWALYALLAGGLTVIGELAILRTDLHGFVGLLVSGLPPLVALGLLVRLERRRAGPAEARLGRVAT
jgi:O-antigen/teichoic acid export membrane protein